MKKQKLIVLCSIMLLAVSLSSCSKPSGFTVGKWNQNTFENSWLNMKFEITSEWSIATKEEIKELIGEGAENLNIEGTSAEQLKAAMELKGIFAFVVENPGVSIQLLFENLEMTTGGTKFTESDYLDEVSKFLIKIPDAKYEVVNRKTTQLANKEFKVMELSLYEGNVLQEYYVYRIDKFMVVIITTFMPEMEATKADFMNKIKVLK